MASVKLTNVKKIYDNKVTAVHDFNLEIKDKEFVVFVGPSGCGKSTTLRMIAGLEDISEGTIEIDGGVVNDLQPKDRNIAMVFQNYALYPHMTVYENIAFSLRLNKEEHERPHTEKELAAIDGKLADLDRKLASASGKKKEKLEKQIEALKKERASNVIERGMSEDVIYEKVTKAAEILGITDYLLRKPRALSGGQRQRVAIGRAMVRDSKVFLMDEPLSNLDAKLRNQMRAEIILLRQKLNTTFVYVTHDQTEAMTLGDRIVIMKDGYIKQVGTPEEVFERPENLFVAEFIGAPKMNVFKTDIIRDGDKYFVTPFGAKMEVTGKNGELLKERDVGSRSITMGIRPEHIVIAKEAAENTVPCTLEVNEMMGSELHLHVRTEDGTSLIIRTPTMQMESEDRSTLIRGAKLNITFPGKAMYFFDPETEQNILV